jgi:TolB protein
VKKLLWLAAVAWVSGALAQDFHGYIQGGEPIVVAVPDFRGTGVASRPLAVFNQVLWADLQDSGRFKMVSKSKYPAFIPQQPADWPGRFPQWVGAPVSTTYVAFGYAASQSGSLVVRGWLNDVRQSQGGAQMMGNTYLGSMDDAGARKIAHQFAADIISKLGGTPLVGTHIYFVSDRTGHKEIWVMDPDGANQRQITRINFIATYPAVSADGSKLAFTAWPGAGQYPRIFIYATDSPRDLHFRNPQASMNGTASFTPDGRRVVFSSSAKGGRNLFSANVDGSDLRQITSGDKIDAEPKVSPNGYAVAFSSNRSGREQIYRVNLDGGDMSRLTDGAGDASNPSWQPEGKVIAFAWTRGYAIGGFNIFWMDAVDQKPKQLTHGQGKNENPSWAPDGIHLAFSSTRSGFSQIWTMLADGNSARRLTVQGHNENPVWSK